MTSGCYKIAHLHTQPERQKNCDWNSIQSMLSYYSFQKAIFFITNLVILINISETINVCTTFGTNPSSRCWVCQRISENLQVKRQGLSKSCVFIINEKINICPKCHGNPSDICWVISRLKNGYHSPKMLNRSFIQAARSLFVQDNIYCSSSAYFTVTPNSTLLNAAPWRTLWKRQKLLSTMFSCLVSLNVNSGVCREWGRWPCVCSEYLWDCCGRHSC